MAKRGQKAKSQAQHEKENTVNATRHAGNEPDPGGAIGPAPDHLPVEAREFWERARRWLTQMGIGKGCDELHLEAASMLWWRLREANRVLMAEGFQQVNLKSGLSSRTAAATEALQVTERLRMWYNEVGFVPSARAALRAGEAEGSDTLDTILRGPPKLEAVS